VNDTDEPLAEADALNTVFAFDKVHLCRMHLLLAALA
jgi:hypothetical protein